MKLAGLNVFFVLALIVSVATAQSETAFTYQGELQQNGSPANDPFDMAFLLFDAASGGDVVGTPIVHFSVPVVEGRFTVELDFGVEAFDNMNRWLEIEVNGFPLSPRTPITRTPYAIQTRGIFVDDQGYVGIGTSTPDVQLSVHEDTLTSNYIRVSDVSTGPTSGLRLGMVGVGNAFIINDEPFKSLSLGTSGTTQMRINDLGHVGINKLAAERMLHVKQDVDNRCVRIEHNVNADNWENGIGVTTRNYKFYYNDLFKADISSVDGSYVQTSDRRLKQDIVEMPAVLDRVNQLRPASYHYLDSSQNVPRSLGFIAQDVEPLFPNLVRESDDGTKGLVYDGFAVISIKAIQELKAENDALRAQLNSLDQLVRQLSSRLEEQSK